MLQHAHNRLLFYNCHDGYDGHNGHECHNDYDGHDGHDSDSGLDY